MDMNNFINSKWTHLKVDNKQRHFRVLSYSKAKKRVELMCVIDNTIHFIGLEKLTDESLWTRGWDQ